MPRRAPPASRQRPSRWLVVFRLVVAVLVVQLTGVGHAAADVAEGLLRSAEAAVHPDEAGSGEHAGHAEHCPIDQPCDDCPAGCPSCHCPNALHWVPPGVHALPSFDVAPTATTRAWANTDTPPRPDPTSVYRPPRAIRPIG